MYLLIIRFQIGLSASCGLKRFIVFLIPNYNHLPTPNFLVTLQRQVGGTASRRARMCGETTCENVRRDAVRERAARGRVRTCSETPCENVRRDAVRECAARRRTSYNISDGQPSANSNDYGKKRL